MGNIRYNPLSIDFYEYSRKELEEKEEQDKEGGIGVREPRKPIKPSDKDSISLPLPTH